MEIYLSRGGERVGPYAVEEINRQLAAGTLSPGDIGWCETSPGWKPLVSIVGVIVPGGASSTAQAIRIATPVALHPRRYAGFWIRLVAHLIDVIVLAIFGLVVDTWFDVEPWTDLGASAPAILLQFALAFLYTSALWWSPMQATIGQRVCVLRVIDGYGGGRISFSRALLRSAGMLLSALLLGVGFIMAAFTERKRGLPDIMADTTVVKDSVVDRWLTDARANLKS